MKKTITIVLTVILTLGLLAGCGGANTDEITVVSREEGSGTRGAFEELFEIEETITTADINDSTGVMLTSVAQNSSAIGYVSMGALKDTVKAVKIDGTEATIDNVKAGTYKIARPFNIATKEGLSAVAQDFIDYILSTEGQLVVEDAGYIPNDDTTPYSGSAPEGKITVVGSSSVTPLMEKLKEAYEEVNANVTIEIQQTDSTSGMKSTAEGICDIGMASRDLKDSELAQGLTPTVIATDGIAVIVSTENTIDELTAEQVKAIYSGEITMWSEVQ